MPRSERFIDWEGRPAKIVREPGEGMFAVFKASPAAPWSKADMGDVEDNGRDLSEDLFKSRFSAWGVES